MKTYRLGEYMNYAADRLFVAPIEMPPGEYVPAEVAERLYEACRFVRAWIAMNIDQMTGIPGTLQAHVTLVEAMDAADGETPTT